MSIPVPGLTWPFQNMIRNMRLFLPLCAALLAIPATAQSDPDHRPMESPSRNGASIGMSMGDMKVVDDNDPFEPNTFIGSLRMEIHSFKNGEEAKESPMEMQLWNSPDKTLISLNAAKTQGTDLKMLNDLKGKWSYIMMATPNGNKTAMKSHKKKIITSGDDKDKNIQFTVTKETKTIDGHPCKKVISRSEDGIMTAWIAQDIPMTFGDLLRNMRQPGQPDRFEAFDGVKGFPLEMTSESIDGKEKTVTYVKDLHLGPVDENIFSLEGYKLMEIPGMGQ